MCAAGKVIAVLFMAICIVLIMLMPIAILDEFARFPFYMSIPLVAVMLNGLLLFTMIRGGRTATLRSSRASVDADRTNRRKNAPDLVRVTGMSASTEDVRCAFEKLHAVVWECVPDAQAGLPEQEQA